MINRWTGTGRLVRDPDHRFTSNGTPVTNFTIAVERSYKKKNGEKEVDYIKIVTWRKLAEICAEHLNKGRMVAVDGSLQIRKSKKDDRTYINPEIVADNVHFFGGKKEGGENEKINDDEFDDDFDIPF